MSLTNLQIAMKKLVSIIWCLLVTAASFGQVAYVQYRAVPADRETEFVENETMHWAKVAQSAIEKGQMEAWHLWRKVGVSEPGSPNYVIVNDFKSLDAMDQSAVWSEENMKAMDADPNAVATNSYAPTVAEYWFQVEDVVPGSSKYALVNYAKPDDLAAFINENKELWKPLHQANVNSDNDPLSSWVLMSVIYPTGNTNKFTAVAIDGFNDMTAALNYLRYQETSSLSPAFQDVISKSKMNEIVPQGFEKSVIYELVKRIDREE